LRHEGWQKLGVITVVMWTTVIVVSEAEVSPNRRIRRNKRGNLNIIVCILSFILSDGLRPNLRCVVL
jgi:hypothetical protein